MNKAGELAVMAGAQMSRVILITLAGIAAAIVLGVVLWSAFRGKEVVTEETPRIAIVTDQTLAAAADANSLELERTVFVATARLEAMESVGGPASTPQEADVRSNTGAVVAGTVPALSVSNQASFLQAALTDELEAQINKMLTSSRRFAVMDPSSVRTAVERMSGARSEAPPPGEASSPSVAGLAVAALGEAVQRGATASTTQVSGSARGPSGGVAYSGSQVVDRVEKGDLAGAAEELKARYLLAASLREPKVTSEVALVEDGLKYRLEADPVFVYRLFDVRQNRTVDSDATQLEVPVVVEVNIPLESRTVAGAIQSQNFATEVLKARRELSTKVQERVARHIADAVLDATSPARLSSVSPLIMSRGANDGVSEGEEVLIVRYGNEIKEGDRIIDVEETPIGNARVIEVRANSAKLQVISGAGFMKDDIVRRTPSSKGGDAGADVAGGAPFARGLGREDILANRANAAQSGLIRERIAVGNLRIIRDDDRLVFPNLDRAIAERLARDPRIEVMSRESLEALANERAIGGARKTYERGGAGVGQAGYVVLGEVTVDVRRSAQTLNVPGAKPREISVSYALIANGSLRIERTDSRLVESFQVSANTPIASGSISDAEAARRVSEAFADAAAQAILPRLFPTEIVSTDGGAVVLNRGQDIGLKVGTLYAVYSLGEPIIDSTTGAQISAGVRRQVGTVRIDDVQPTVSVASVVGDGGRIAKGQIAEPAANPVPRPSTHRAKGAARSIETRSEEPAVPF